MSTGKQKTYTRKKIFLALASLLALLVFVYISFVGTIIFHIVDRKNTSYLAQEKATTVSRLESQYLSLVDTVDSTYAREKLGLQKPQAIHYASPNVTVVRNFTGAHNEI